MFDSKVLQCSLSYYFWYCCHFIKNKIFQLSAPAFKEFNIQVSPEDVITNGSEKRKSEVITVSL